VAVLLVEADAVTIHSGCWNVIRLRPVRDHYRPRDTGACHARAGLWRTEDPLWAVAGDGATDQAAVDAASRIRSAPWESGVSIVEGPSTKLGWSKLTAGKCCRAHKTAARKHLDRLLFFIPNIGQRSRHHETVALCRAIRPL